MNVLGLDKIREKFTFKVNLLLKFLVSIYDQQEEPSDTIEMNLILEADKEKPFDVPCFNFLKVIILV